MKKLMILCAVILGFTFAASAQTDKKADFGFKEENHAFGKIPQGKPVTYTFTFTNTGTEPLILSDVRPSCGCTAADYTKNPILPGQGGIIKVTYSAAAVGAFTKSIIITSNAKTSTKVIYISGEVLAPDAPAQGAATPETKWCFNRK